MQIRGIKDVIILFMLVVGCILLAVYLAINVNKVIHSSKHQNDAQTEKVLLIDPGHGGRDGGASASDGTVEKNINLAISLPLADMLRIFGYPVGMTRVNDRMVCDSELVPLRQQKISDMKNRLKKYNSSRLTISIHQNHFSQSQYHGTQIFYGKQNEESRLLAASIRQIVLDKLQPQNTRELKKATKDIYLLSNATTPAIIIECGFLSNSTELSKLKDEEYQQNMACAIACGVLAYNP
ncbi:MAG: N-acetylmuramoyl-L-alanine amidase [Oscillospiraceae bacterium]|nr:N-acetylmuramoyl-L-alanine amidase [Oscillospiraceae bacterium]MDD4414267.1 N-acetylmuramoyl-L-alanine amidase [Oscillospiraceae bacterium]